MSLAALPVRSVPPVPPPQADVESILRSGKAQIGPHCPLALRAEASKLRWAPTYVDVEDAARAYDAEVVKALRISRHHAGPATTSSTSPAKCRAPAVAGRASAAPAPTPRARARAARRPRRAPRRESTRKKPVDPLAASARDGRRRRRPAAADPLPDPNGWGPSTYRQEFEAQKMAAAARRAL